MSHYIAGFTFYTLAIIGLLLLAYIIAKKSMMSSNYLKAKNRYLDVEHSLSIAPRKTLQVVKAGNEKFLIALDSERTTFLTKLAEQDILCEGLNETDIQASPKQNRRISNESIMRSMLTKINTK